MKKNNFKLVLCFVLVLGAAVAYASGHARESESVFDNIEYYDTHRDELSESNYEHLCLLAQLYLNDAGINQQMDEPALDSFTKAADFYKKAISLNSGYPLPYRGLAVINYYGLKNNEEALKYAQEAITKKWDYFDVYLIAGNILKEQSKIEEAKKFLTTAKAKIDEIATTDPSVKNIPDYAAIEEFLK